MLSPWIIENLPEHKVYVEVFSGAASVLLRKERSYAEVYNDINSELVSLFRIMRDQDKNRRLKELLKLTPFSRDEFLLSYEKTTDEMESARRMIVRSFMGRGSDSVEYKKTGFRSAYCMSNRAPSRDWPNYPDALDFFLERLQGVVIENLGYPQIIENNDGENTLFYLDPPYLPATRNSKNNYQHELNINDHINLLWMLNKIEGKYVISGYESSLYHDMLIGAKFIKKNTVIHGTQKRVECLWIRDNQ